MVTEFEVVRIRPNLDTTRQVNEFQSALLLFLLLRLHPFNTSIHERLLARPELRVAARHQPIELSSRQNEREQKQEQEQAKAGQVANL